MCRSDIALRIPGELFQCSIKFLYGTCLLGRALGKCLGTAGQLLGMSGYLLLRMEDICHCFGQGRGQAVQSQLNRAEVSDKRTGRRYIEVAMGKLIHDTVQILHIPVNQFH